MTSISPEIRQIVIQIRDIHFFDKPELLAILELLMKKKDKPVISQVIQIIDMVNKRFGSGWFTYVNDDERLLYPAKLQSAKDLISVLEFNTEEFREIYKILGIPIVRTKPYSEKNIYDNLIALDKKQRQSEIDRQQSPIASDQRTQIIIGKNSGRKYTVRPVAEGGKRKIYKNKNKNTRKKNRKTKK